MLLQVSGEGADGRAVLESLYATQYMAPGTPCCFAGRIPAASPRLKRGASRAGSALDPADCPEAATPPQLAEYTHALHLRFQNLQAGLRLPTSALNHGGLCCSRIGQRGAC